MSTDKLILVGAGGHARVVFDALRTLGAWRSIEIRDDVPKAASACFDGLPVMTPALPPEMDGVLAHVALGHNDTRRRLAEKLLSRGARLASVVHPRATVSSLAEIADGTFIAANAVVTVAARVGAAAIINHGAVVDHDCAVGAFAHIAPGAVLGGGVVIGAGVLVGAGAVILPGIKIGDGACIGAGAVVTKPVAPQVVVTGVPARVVKQGNEDHA
jgi:sugar O-acyltransferase (sialic acid O-acetyltransferase NeuD family)